MPKKKSNEIRVATLTIHRASDMTEKDEEKSLIGYTSKQTNSKKTVKSILKDLPPAMT